MVLAAGNKIEFYQSENLLQWEKTSEFFPAELGLSGLCECPDLFPVETESGTAWSIQNLTIEVSENSMSINSKKIERKVEGKCNITLIVDKGYLELFADDGIISYSCNLQ